MLTDKFRPQKGSICEELDFSQNRLTDEAVAELVRVLCSVEIEIVVLKLYKNGLTDRSAQQYTTYYIFSKCKKTAADTLRL